MIIVDVSAAVPPYEQIRSQVAAQIRSGELPHGHRLPSIRQLAGDLRVAPGTVARAYSELESAGLISSSRASGSTVVAPQPATASIGELEVAVNRLLDEAVRAGLNRADLLGLVQSVWAKRKLSYLEESQGGSEDEESE